MHANSPYVLVVDDSTDTADSLSALLDLWGYDAEPRYAGAAALEAASARPPDAVVLDIAMPGMDGFQIARRLRDLPGCSTTSVVAVTGYETLAIQAREAGIVEYLVKPVDLDFLRALLGRLLVCAEPSRAPSESRRAREGRRAELYSRAS